jgi:hypothetical protein
MTARLLALGQPDLVPYTLVLINLLAIPAGVLVLAAWLRRRNVSPWFALLYALYTGTVYTFTRDTVEPLSYLLVLLAIYQFDFADKRRVLWAGLLFSAAILTRDKVLLFAAIYGGALLLHGVLQTRKADWRHLWENVPPAAIFALLALGPFLLYKTFLHLWLGGGSEQPGFGATAPLSGVSQATGSLARMVSQSMTVYIPSLVAGAVGIWALLRRRWRPEVFMLVGSAAVTFSLSYQYYATDYYGVARVGMVTVIAAILCIPTFRDLVSARLWLPICVAGWCSWSWILFIVNAWAPWQ